MSFYWICPRQFTAWLYTVLQRNIWEINQRVLKSETEMEISKFCKLYWDLEEEVSTVLYYYSIMWSSGILNPSVHLSLMIELGSITFSSTFWRSLLKIGNNSSLNVLIEYTRTHVGLGFSLWIIFILWIKPPHLL